MVVSVQKRVHETAVDIFNHFGYHAAMIKSHELRDWYLYLSSKGDEAIAFFEEERWWGSRICPNPNCGSSDTVPFPSTDTPYRCLPCGQLFSVRTNAEYDDGRPLWQWLLDHEFMLYENDGLSREQAATKMFEDYRWRASPVGPVCPHCGPLKQQPLVVESDGSMPYRCRRCRRFFNARIGTTFGYGKIPLWRWLEVIIHYGNGGRLTSVELASKLGCTQRLAWKYRELLTEAFSKSTTPSGVSNPTQQPAKKVVP